MSPLVQFLGFVAILAMFAIVFFRPGGVLAVVMAVGIVVAAIFVSWQQIEHDRQRRAQAEASQQAIEAATGAAAAANAPVRAWRSGRGPT